MSQTRKLILHIGFPKTGSSAIQAWLAKNSSALAQHGIAYQNFKEEALQDRISNGNGRMLLSVFRAARPAFALMAPKFERDFVPHFFHEFDTAIVSAEGLAGAPGPRLEWFSKVCAEQKISVLVVGYMRTVYDHCYSAYQQFVKQSAETRTFEEFADDYKNFQYRNVWSWHSVFGDALIMKIYDTVKKNLVADFVRSAGIGHLGLDTEQGNVNRSLTFGELELLRHLNAYHKGTLSRRVSDALIYAFPEKKSDYQFNPRIAEKLEQRFRADIEKVNNQFFANGPDRLLVSRQPDPQSAPSASPRALIALDPMIDVVLKALGEGAAEVKERETSLEVRLCLELGKKAMDSEKWAVAAKQLQRVLKLDPDNAEAGRLLSGVYDQSGIGTDAVVLGRNEEKQGRNGEKKVVRTGGNSSMARAAADVMPRLLRNEDAAANVAGMVNVDNGRRQAPHKEARDRLDYIKSRLREISEERKQLAAERTNLLQGRK